MTDERIDVVSRSSRETTSLRNLLQSLRTADESWVVDFHRVRRPELPGDNRVVRAVEYGLLTLVVLLTGLKLRVRSDLVVVHKPLGRELVEVLSGTIFSERAFLWCDPVVYATFDANYVFVPEKSALLFERSDLVYATSRAIEREAETHAPEDRVAFIPPSVDTERFTPQRSVPDRFEADEDLVLGWIGNVGPERDRSNLRVLADGLDSLDLNGVALVFVYFGGEFPEDLRSRFEGTGARVELVQSVPHERMPGVINGFDVGLAPLLDTEFDRGRSSEKVREYMACGVPVIASAVGENRHMIPDDVGYLVEEPREWEEGLRLLSDPEIRREMGRDARRHVVETFSLPVVSDRVRAEFRELL